MLPEEQNNSKVRTQEGEEEGAIIKALEGWMEEFKGKWERMEDNLVGNWRELEEMKRREDKWRVEKERMEKRMGELELKLEKGLKIRMERRKWKSWSKG